MAKHNEEKGGGLLFLFFSGPKFNHAKELHHTCAKAEEVSSVYPLFPLPSALIEREVSGERRGLKIPQEATGL